MFPLRKSSLSASLVPIVEEQRRTNMPVFRKARPNSTSPVLPLLLLLLAWCSQAIADSNDVSPVIRAVSCVCTASECEDVQEWECPGGGVVWDACRCCRVCARVEDEPCGGPEGFHGACAPGLHCVLQPSLRRTSADATGTCKRVPGSRAPEGCAVGQDSAFGCDIVGRVCRCAHVPPCGPPPEEDGGWPERRRRRREAGVWGRRKRGKGRRERLPGGSTTTSSSALFTFDTLEECEMNLAEVLRQEEATATGGTRGSPVPLQNCTVGGCDWSCPEGSAPRPAPDGPCVCLPSLCPSAALPFSCPFGARVLRRASRIPGDCCDLYECASPPPAAPAHGGPDTHAEGLAPAPSSSAPQQEHQGHGGAAQCGDGPRTAVGCDIVAGRACRCARVPVCGPKRPRGRRRRRRRRRVGTGPAFASLEECKERLSQMLRIGGTEDEEPDDSETTTTPPND